MQISFKLKKTISKYLLKKHTNLTDVEWVSVPGGKYMMGSPEGEAYRRDDETLHEVTVHAFKISKYAVTVHQFKKFIEATGYVTDAEKGNDDERGSVIWKSYASKFKSGINWKCDERGRVLSDKDMDHPVVHISWNDALAFTDWKGCRLPTEAEWEYACRAGSLMPFNTGYELKPMFANYKPDNFNSKHFKNDFNNEIVPVGEFKPNAWGLYDMHGNVGEWCSDFYASYPSAPQINPCGPDSGEFRVVRGGSWLSYMRSCRSARRIYCKPDDSMYDIGFRVAF